MTAAVRSAHGKVSDFHPVKLGPLRVWPPVVLAPMAGVTNYPFRSLCRRFGAGLYVSEMVTARPLAMGVNRTVKLASFGKEEWPRSLQLYGVDPYHVGEAVAWLVGEGRVDHIDMNFGCPVKKVTRKGGGAAIPFKRLVLRDIVRAAVRSAESVPVTIKFRMGINREHLTFLDAGRIGEEEGCAAVALHGRTAAQLYDGRANWDAIGELKAHVRSIPVFGNGDIWEAKDALRMMRHTGCDAVVVGRGCLGRPWLFRDLAAAFEGRVLPNPPSLGEVADVMLEHAELLERWLGHPHGMRSFRRHSSWYTKGFHGSGELRKRLMRVETLDDLRRCLAKVDRDEPFPPSAMRVIRGKTGGTQSVALPHGYLRDPWERPDVDPEAEHDPGGG